MFTFRGEGELALALNYQLYPLVVQCTIILYTEVVASVKASTPIHVLKIKLLLLRT